MSSDEVHDAYIRWVTEQAWSIWCVLTFRAVVRKNVATRRFKSWITAIERRFKLQLTWVRVVEEGKVDGRIHLHVLLGGISATRATRWQLESTWHHGVSQIRKFDQTKRVEGISYVLKSVGRSDCDQVDVMFATGGKGPTQLSGDINNSEYAGALEAEKKRHLQAENGPSDAGAGTVTIPSITIPKGPGFHASREGDFLVIVLPFTAPRPSKCSGKTSVVGSTGGLRPTLVDFGGRTVSVNVVATINPKGPAWMQRIAPLLARWEGKLS